MASWRQPNGLSGARGRLYHYFTGDDPAGALHLGYVRHPHLIGQWWVDTDGNPTQPEIDYGAGEGGTWFLGPGYKCRVRIRFKRNGVEEDAILTHSNGYSVTLTAATMPAETIDEIAVRGL